MKICIIVNSLEKKGPVIVASTLANQYVRLGHQVDVIYVKSSVQPVYLDERINVKEIMRCKLRGFFHYDVIHSHSFVPDFIAKLLSFFISKTVFIHTIHNFLKLDFFVDYNPVKAHLLNFFWSRVLSKENVVYISKTQQEYLKLNYSSKFKNNTSKQIYNPVVIDTDMELSTENNLTEFISNAKVSGNILLGVCSVLTERKSISTVINALKHLPKNYYLMIIGDGPERDELEVLSVNNNVSDRVFFTGFISKPHSLFKCFDIYIFPSRVEAFGLSGIEAGMLGVSLIVSDIDSFIEIYPRAVVDFFKVGDYFSLSQVILSHHKVNTDLSLTFNQIYSVEVIAEQYLEFYVTCKKNS